MRAAGDTGGVTRRAGGAGGCAGAGALFFAGARALAVELAGALEGGLASGVDGEGTRGMPAGKLGLGGLGPRGGKGGGTRFIGSEWSVSRGGARREVRSRTGAHPESETKERTERRVRGTREKSGERARENGERARETSAREEQRERESWHGARVRLTPAEPRVVCADLTPPEWRWRVARWSSLVARRAHNPKVVGSNPTRATKTITRGCP